MKNNLTSFLLAVAIFSLSHGKAEEPAVQNKIDQGHEVTASQMASEYNAPARYDVKGNWDFYFNGSFIYWQAAERGLDFTRITPATGSIYSKREYLNFKFKPGFKAAMGLAADSQKGWLWGIEYTWLLVRASRAISVDPASGSELIKTWGYYPSFDAYYAKGKWKLNYNIFDANASRPFYLGAKLTLKPHAGLRGGWLNQKMTAIYQGTTDAYTIPYSSEKTWLVGPRIGLNSDFLLGSGIRFFASGAGSLLYQHFKTVLTETTYDETPIDAAVMNEKTHSITPCFEAGAGFAWGSYFGSSNSWHYDLKVGYDFQVYLQQNAMRPLKDIGQSYNGRIDANMGNLMLQGLTVTMQFDF